MTSQAAQLSSLPERKTIFTEEQLAELRSESIPKHVAFIMDGNRRWAKRRGALGMFTGLEGHWAGARVVSDLVKAGVEVGMDVLTFYAFSTENWQRPKAEVRVIWQILESYLQENRQLMHDQGVRFHVIGDISPFPDTLKDEIELTLQATKEGRVLDLVVALNYGGRDEIKRATQAIAREIASGKLRPEEITEETIRNYLDTASWPDPDLLIRTSGEERISNFLVWQLAYTEFYSNEVLWPDFTPHHFYHAIKEFQKRERRIGR